MRGTGASWRTEAPRRMGAPGGWGLTRPGGGPHEQLQVLREAFLAWTIPSECSLTEFLPVPGGGEGAGPTSVQGEPRPSSQRPPRSLRLRV